MDMLENKKIRDKINSLDELPESYHPNMASKWSLLEAGLERNDNDKRKVIAWKRITVAAVLLMMAGSAFVLFNYKETSQLSEKSTVIESAPTLSEANVPNASTSLSMTEQQSVPEMKKDLQGIKKPERKKYLSAPIKEDRIAVIPIKDSIVQPLAPVKETGMLTANAPKAKKRRFIEMDFNDNIAVNKPIDPVPDPPQARFKINIGSGQEGNTREPIISFSF
jgi:hypothetical protein